MATGWQLGEASAPRACRANVEIYYADGRRRRVFFVVATIAARNGKRGMRTPFARAQGRVHKAAHARA